MMCKKSVLFVLFMVFGLVVPNALGAEDPNFIAQYWFDDGEGVTVYDESGNGRDGSINGAVAWAADGVIGGSLNFTGGTVDITNNVDTLSFGDTDLSITAWINSTSTDCAFFSKDAGTLGLNTWFGIADSGTSVYRNRNNANIFATSTVATGEWVHVALTQKFDPTDGSEQWSMFVNGVMENTQKTDVNRDDGENGVYMGRGEEYEPESFIGLLDELYVYGFTLNDEDVPFVMEGATWKPRARDLMPEDGVVLDGTSVELSWSAGWAATALGENLAPDSHAIYLSTDEEAVRNGDASALVDTITGTSYSVSDLTTDSIYYWRVDEVNDAVNSSPWTGVVQSFEVPALKAKNPVPADGSKFQSLALELSWVPGIGATSHVVYIGNDKDEVENATTGGVTVTDPMYAPPGLKADKAYYWRVDQVNGGVTKGDVWMFTTVPVADGDHIDPNLVMWYKLNEGEGDVVVDYSGYGNHGGFASPDGVRTPQWDIGQFGGGIRVWDSAASDGLGYIDVPGIEGYESPETTICGWMHQEQMVSAWNGVWASVATPGAKHNIMQVNGNMRVNWPQGNYKWTHGWDVDSGLALPVGEWFFIAVSVSADGADYYINNATFRRDAGYVPLTSLQNGASLGRDKSKGTGTTLPGRIDDWRIYNKALTVEELAEVMRGEPWLAWNPQPGNGITTDILRASEISWNAGDGAVAHDVYVTTDPNGLINADRDDTSGIFRGTQDGTMYDLSGEIATLTTYYWRIDEVQADGSIRKGNQWKFDTSDYIIIENFNQYKDDDVNAVWNTWLDGYGAPGMGLGGSLAGYATIPYMEGVKTNSAGQAMPMPFSNDGSEVEDIEGGKSNPVHSEVMMEYADAQDWASLGMATLSVAFRGEGGAAEFSEADGVYTVLGTGNDIWAEADTFYLVHKTLSGDGSITAKVESVEDTHNWARVGVMIRNSLDAGSAHGCTAVTPANGINFTYRPYDDNASSNDKLNGDNELGAPYWVRLERAGGILKSYASVDGSTWVQVGFDTAVTLDNEVLIGLAVNSHAGDRATCEGVFSNVSTTGNVSGDFVGTEIGILGNDPDRLYVALTDAAGKRVEVDHPENPDAILNDNYTNFEIALADLEADGLNLAAVKSLSLGVGTEGGAGTGQGIVYFDDIFLLPEVVEPNIPEPNVPEPNVPEPNMPDVFVIANFDTDGTGPNWTDGFGSGGRIIARAISTDTPDESAGSMQIDIDYAAGGWGSAWGAFSATGVVGPDGINASGYTTMSIQAKSTLDGAAVEIWLEGPPNPDVSGNNLYTNAYNITGIGTEWATYEIDLDPPTRTLRGGLHDLSIVSRMSFGGPVDLGAPYTILIDNITLK